jgi:hypothetical protein
MSMSYESFLSNESSFPNNSYRIISGSNNNRYSMPSENFNLDSNSHFSDLHSNLQSNLESNLESNVESNVESNLGISRGDVEASGMSVFLMNNGDSRLPSGSLNSHLESNFGMLDGNVERSEINGFSMKEGESRLRIFNGIHSNHKMLDGNIHLYMDGFPLSLNLNHNDFTAYMGCKSGSHVLTLKMSDNGMKVGDHNLELESNHDYTVILWGKITKRGKLIFGVSLHADIQTCPAPGHGVFQFIHGAVSDRNVDVLLDDDEIFTGIPFNHSELHHRILPVGSHHIRNIRIRCAHTKEHLLGPIPLSLISGGSYTLIIYRYKKEHHGLLIHNNPNDIECQKIVHKPLHPLVGKWHHIGHIGPFGDNYNANTECTLLSTHIQTTTSFFNDNSDLKVRLIGHVTQDNNNLGHFILNLENNTEYTFVIHHHFPNIIIIGCPHRSSLFILSRKSHIRARSLEKIQDLIRQLAYNVDNLIICPNTIHNTE